MNPAHTLKHRRPKKMTRKERAAEKRGPLRARPLVLYNGWWKVRGRWRSRMGNKYAPWDREARP